MQVTTIIPTYNRVKELEETLDSLNIQTTLPKEIIIVDDSDNDEIENLIVHRKNDFEEENILLKYIINKKEKSLTIARNIGIENAIGDIILFLDDDVVLDKDYITEILKVHEKYPNAWGVQGYITNYGTKKDALAEIFYLVHSKANKNSLLPSMQNVYARPLNKVINCQWLVGNNCSYKREILEQFRFDENLKRFSSGEDDDLSYRIFKKYPNALYQTPNATIIHKISSTSRLPNRTLLYMTQVYHTYLFYKNIDQTLKNKIIFLWSRIGILVLNINSLISKPSKSRLLILGYIINAYIMCIKHINNIKKGNLNFFNTTLR